MSAQPRDDLTAALQHLRRLAGDPSFRKIARKTEYSHTTVADAITGSRRVSWDVIEQVVDFLGGDVEQVRQLWLAARELEEPLPPSQGIQATASGSNVTGSNLTGAGGYRPISANNPLGDLVEARWDPVLGTWRFGIPLRIAPTVMKELVQEERRDDQA